MHHWAHINRQKMLDLIRRHQLEVNEQLGVGRKQDMAAVLEIIFDNTKDRAAFMTWLDNSGEQYFWDAEGDCTTFEYDYNHKRVLVHNTCTET